MSGWGAPSIPIWASWWAGCGAAALLYIAVKSILGFSGASLWSMVGIAVLGIAAMLIAAFVYRSPFFLLRRVAYRPEGGAPTPLSR